jgi:hypothetical protein
MQKLERVLINRIDNHSQCNMILGFKNSKLKAQQKGTANVEDLEYN